MEKVLVTGATGYIALHCVQQLLDQGYAVNGSIRSPERKNEVIEALKNSGTSTENLNLFVFDLTNDEGWDDGMEGCDYLLHCLLYTSPSPRDSDQSRMPSSA